jgi:hypothetical protein
LGDGLRLGLFFDKEAEVVARTQPIGATFDVVAAFEPSFDDGGLICIDDDEGCVELFGWCHLITDLGQGAPIPGQGPTGVVIDDLGAEGGAFFSGDLFYFSDEA